MQWENMDPRAWYIRWLFWSLGIYDAFNGDWKADSVKLRGTNLCFATRVTVIYAPLIILLHLEMYGMAILILTYIPVMVWGWSTYLTVVGAIVLLVLAIVGIKHLSTWMERRNREQENHGWERQLIQVRRKATTPRFSEVVMGWISAKKSKICPFITFKNLEEEVES